MADITVKFEESNVRAAYQQVAGTLAALCEEVGFILDKRIEAAGIKIHGIEKRVKKIDSLLDKARRTECSAPLTDIRDIAGVRIICLFRDDLKGLDELIHANFQVISKDDKTDGGNVLGYQSMHYICELQKSLIGARYEYLVARKFEIQTRTLCMHCWATVSHYIDYKGEWDVPNDLRKALTALSGLFYVADSEFQQFNTARLLSRKAAEQAVPSASKDSSEINLDTMSAYLENYFGDRAQHLPHVISELVLDIKNSGYTSMAEVDRDVKRAKLDFSEYEKHSAPIDKYGAVGVVRLSLCIASREFIKNYLAKHEIIQDPVRNFRKHLNE